MIEANNLEINVDDLKQKILQEVARHRSVSTFKNTSISTSKNIRKTVAVSGISEAACKNIEHLLDDAEMNSQIPTKFPDKFNRFPFNISKPLQRFSLKLYGFLFKKQRVVNLPLIQAVRDSLTINRKLIEQVSTLQQQIHVMGEHLVNIQAQVSGISEHLVNTQAQVSGIGEHLANTQAQVSGIGEHLANTQAQVSGISEHLTNSQAQTNVMSEHLAATQAQVNAMGEHLASTQAQTNVMSEHLAATQAQVNAMGEHLTSTQARTNVMSEHLAVIDERYIKNDSYLKNDLAQQKRLITLFLEEAQKRLSEPFNQEQLQTLLNEQQHSLDAFYFAFEEQFRGKREEIIDRLKVYLPVIQEASVGTPDTPILDVGCGRGEWLELLHESGYTARGLDINRTMIDQCKTRGLEVIEGNVISYLQSLPDATLGVLTGFHIIEHLPFECLIKLFEEAVRVLKPGGVAIFETPNPQNLLTSSVTFYVDPTHLNPLPSPLIKFVAEMQGLSQVKILELHPYPQEFRVFGSDVAERFNNYFYGPQDYSVIGYKL